MTVNNTIQRKKAVKVINAVDLFCGAGGSSSGLINAVNSLGYDIKLTAINHWDVAIATHSKNHEDVEHFCQSIDTINPTDIVPGGRLQLLVASPECTHHFRARGGKPRSDQKRADAWLLMRWIEKLYVENILIENVKEFIEWGPLNADGKPSKRHKGEYFRQFVSALEVNYNVAWKIINCADHGDPTTRERLFIIARRPKHRKIVWPERTHASRKELAKLAAQPELFEKNGHLEPWVAAREIIDWELEGKSIFRRKKPLSPNTMKRIFAGLMKYSLKPFIVPQFSQPETRDIDQPLGTVTTTSRGVGLAEPFLVNLKNKDRRDRSIDEPTFTQAAGGNHQGVVEVKPFTLTVERALTNRSAPRSVNEPVATVTGTPRIGIVEGEAFMLGQQSCASPRSVDEPTPTIAGAGAISLVEVDQFLMSAGGPELDAKTVLEPMRTILTRDHQALVEAFLVKFHGGENGHNRAYPVDEPMKTLDTSNRFGLVEVEPFVINTAHNGDHIDKKRHAVLCRDIDEPVSTIVGSQTLGVVEPFIVPFFGEREGQEPRTRDIDEPAPTVTTHGRMGLCEPYIVNMKGKSNARSVDDPTFTQTSKQNQYLAEPYIVKFYGNEKGAESIDDPLATVTSKDRFGLCIPSIGAVLDIRFRMLQPHELAAAMSFPKEYEFTGNREAKVKQIGNAVPLMTAKALCRSLLS